jgi:hypothetical protein
MLSKIRSSAETRAKGAKISRFLFAQEVPKSLENFREIQANSKRRMVYVARLRALRPRTTRSSPARMMSR